MGATYIETFRMRSALVNMVHQIGGWGAVLQSSDLADSDHILLFQAVYDEAVGFDWGDCGILQYWISPRDLAEGNWDKVKFLMECL